MNTYSPIKSIVKLPLLRNITITMVTLCYSISVNGMWNCGGVIIHEQWIITSEHWLVTE